MQTLYDKLSFRGEFDSTLGIGAQGRDDVEEKDGRIVETLDIVDC